MKCMIVSDDEVGHWEALIGKYPNEFIRIVPGYALEDCFCDSAVPLRRIEKGQHCFAVTLYTPERPYTPWECAHIRPEPTKADQGYTAEDVTAAAEATDRYGDDALERP